MKNRKCPIPLGLEKYCGTTGLTILQKRKTMHTTALFPPFKRQNARGERKEQLETDGQLDGHYRKGWGKECASRSEQEERAAGEKGVGSGRESGAKQGSGSLFWEIEVETKQL